MQLRNILYGGGLLNPANKYHRILRRALLFAALGFIGQLATGAPEAVDPLYLPIVLAALGSLDKIIREEL